MGVGDETACSPQVAGGVDVGDVAVIDEVLHAWARPWGGVLEPFDVDRVEAEVGKTQVAAERVVQGCGGDRLDGHGGHDVADVAVTGRRAGGTCSTASYDRSVDLLPRRPHLRGIGVELAHERFAVHVGQTASVL